MTKTYSLGVILFLFMLAVCTVIAYMWGLQEEYQAFQMTPKTSEMQRIEELKKTWSEIYQKTKGSDHRGPNS